MERCTYTSRGAQDFRQPPRKPWEGLEASELPEGADPVDALISDFQPPECEKIHWWYFRPPSL